MCDPCFEEAAPELAQALAELRPPCTVQLLETRLHRTCAACGGRFEGQRFAGHHRGDPLCTVCFKEHAPELTALLLLDESALEAADGGRDAPGLLAIAIRYSKLLFRLDAERPRTAPPPAARIRRP